VPLKPDKGLVAKLTNRYNKVVSIINFVEDRRPIKNRMRRIEDYGVVN